MLKITTDSIPLIEYRIAMLRTIPAYWGRLSLNRGCHVRQELIAKSMRDNLLLNRISDAVRAEEKHLGTVGDPSGAGSPPP